MHIRTLLYQRAHQHGRLVGSYATAYAKDNGCVLQRHVHEIYVKCALRMLCRRITSIYDALQKKSRNAHDALRLSTTFVTLVNFLFGNVVRQCVVHHFAHRKKRRLRNHIELTADGKLIEVCAFGLIAFDDDVCHLCLQLRFDLIIHLTCTQTHCYDGLVKTSARGFFH
ncbi:MAG: hypothetical protein ACK55Z_00185, partial [bacterium]